MNNKNQSVLLSLRRIRRKGVLFCFAFLPENVWNRCVVITECLGVA